MPWLRVETMLGDVAIVGRDGDGLLDGRATFGVALKQAKASTQIEDGKGVAGGWQDLENLLRHALGTLGERAFEAVEDQCDHVAGGRFTVHKTKRV